MKHLANDKLIIIGQMRIMRQITFELLFTVSINGINLVMP